MNFGFGCTTTDVLTPRFLSVEDHKQILQGLGPSDFRWDSGIASLGPISLSGGTLLGHLVSPICRPLPAAGRSLPRNDAFVPTPLSVHHPRRSANPGNTVPPIVYTSTLNSCASTLRTVWRHTVCLCTQASFGCLGVYRYTDLPPPKRLSEFFFNHETCVPPHSTACFNSV